MNDGTLSSFFASLADQELAGGCDQCEAVQTLVEDTRYVGVWHLTISHDDDCPVLRAMTAGSN